MEFLAGKTCDRNEQKGTGGARNGLKIDNKQQCVERLKSDKYTIRMTDTQSCSDMADGGIFSFPQIFESNRML